MQAGGAHFFAEEGGELSEAEKQQLERQQPAGKRGSIAVEATYRVQADGHLVCGWKVDASGALPAILQPGLYK